MEEFVSFDIAKKLKEKGFDIPCIYAYCEKGGWNKYTQKREPITYILRTDGNPFGTYYSGKNWNEKYEINKNKIQCSAPTISQVLKWFREEKEIDIVLSPVFVYNDDFNGIREYGVHVFAPSLNKPVHCGYFNLWKKAAVVGVEYVLGNLI